MIKTFRDGETERLWKEEPTPRIPASLRKAALKKLQLLNAATALGELAVPPGNRLELLRANRQGQYSIRINDQFCICFEWRDGNAYRVEITDCH